MINLTAIGYLGADAVQKQAGQKTVIEFSICHTQKMAQKEYTTWVKCSLWDKPALLQYLKKGTQVHISGVPGTYGYIKDNNAMHGLECVVFQIELLSSKKENNG